MVSSSIATGNVWTGWKAGSVFSRPGARSKRERWRGHSTVQVATSNSPSASGPLSWEQRSSIAYRAPSQLKTPIFVPSCSTRRMPPGGSSAAGQTEILVPAVSVKGWGAPTSGHSCSLGLNPTSRWVFWGADGFGPPVWSYLQNPRNERIFEDEREDQLRARHPL